MAEQHTPGPKPSDPDDDDQFFCIAFGHSFNAIDESDCPRDECPLCGEDSVQRTDDLRAALQTTGVGKP
ncbi:hypothetical protein JMUB7490_25840 [Staphylococcus aureus]